MTDDLSYIAPDLRPLAVPVGSLTLDPENVRLHSERNLQAIMTSYARFGQRKPIVVNRTTGQGITEDGNGQLLSAIRLGWSHIAVVWVEDDEDTARAYAIAANQTGLSSSWDYQGLASHIQALTANGFDVSTLGFSDFELEPLLQASWVPPAIDAPTEPQAPTPPPGEEEALPGEVPSVAWSPFTPVEIANADMPIVQQALDAYRVEVGDHNLPDGDALVRVCQYYLDAMGASV